MKIYAAEKEAGLEEILSNPSNASIKYDALVENPKIKVDKRLFTKGSKEDFDLFSSYSILVSTGWNGNDDVFTAEEAWKARHTPEDKPFNYGHDEKDIIGHITSNAVIDTESRFISDDTEQPPKDFHILSGFVLYRRWSDAAMAERINTIIKEIDENKWFVSMECLFSDFDYALSNDNENHIVARSEESAFLTKHLKAFGGLGKYGNYRVARVLKDITFSGKGLVKQPANPNSIIFNKTILFDGVQSSIAKLTHNEERKIMSEDIKNVESKLTEINEKLSATLKENTGFKSKAEEDAKKIVALETEVAAKSTKLTEVLADLETAKTSHEKLVAEFEAARKELDSIKAEAKKVARTSAMKEVGLSDKDIEENLSKFESLDDAAFASIVSLLKSSKATVEETEEAKKARLAAEAEAKAQAELEALKKLEAEKGQAGLSTSESNVDTDEALAQEIAKYMESNRTAKASK